MNLTSTKCVEIRASFFSTNLSSTTTVLILFFYKKKIKDDKMSLRELWNFTGK